MSGAYACRFELMHAMRFPSLLEFPPYCRQIFSPVQILSVSAAGNTDGIKLSRQTHQLLLWCSEVVREEDANVLQDRTCGAVCGDNDTCGFLFSLQSQTSLLAKATGKRLELWKVGIEQAAR